VHAGLVDAELELVSVFVAPERLDVAREDEVEEFRAVALGRYDRVLGIRADGEQLRRGFQFVGRKRLEGR
jgi:hypothetical protein